MQRRAENRDDRDRQQDAGEREQDIEHARDKHVYPFAVKARDNPEQRADHDRADDGEQADPERDARAVDHAAEDIAAEVVGAEPVLAGRRLEPVGQHLRFVIERRD